MPFVLAVGNPLLDMQVRDGEEVLSKYKLKANDAILVDDERRDIYDYVRSKYEIRYVAGGAGQNTARAAQYCLPPNSVSYLGCVAADASADQLRAANEKEGLKAAYEITKTKEPTGSCAVVITGHDRSMVTLLGAAETFTPDHLMTEEVKRLIDQADFIYQEGFFLTHGLESALLLAKTASSYGKTHTLNLSAPFVAQFFKSQIDELLPYVDILFCNDDEAKAFATAHEFGTEDVAAIASKIAQLPRASTSSKPRTIVITQGSKATVVASGEGAKTQTFDVEPLKPEQIVDTNGAGDAFCGGFIAALASGQSLERAVEVGHRMGRMCVQQNGPTFAYPKQDVMA